MGTEKVKRETVAQRQTRVRRYGKVAASELNALWETLEDQEIDIKELRADLAELRNRTYMGPMRHFAPPACEGVAPDGGSSAAHSLFGYVHVADEGEGYCDCCGKPASEHECPEVISDRYDSQHPESEHDGGLGSGDWIGPWEDKR
jgi:hypothetical protein